MLNLCLTFDYEMFFGKSDYSVDNVLIEPARRIMKVLKEEDIPATFFSDAAMCMQHRKYGLNRISDALDNQMLDMYSEGHDVQLHIHPSWFQSVYNGKEWTFHNEYYRLHSFEDREIAEIFQKTKRYLESVLKTKDAGYQCIAFRAGGFCIQPEQKILHAMMQNGLVIDSSVCKNLSADTSTHYYDFRKMPDKANWYFSKDTGLRGEDDAGNFFEIPVGSVSSIPEKWFIVHGNPRMKTEAYKGQTSKETDKQTGNLCKIYKRIHNFFSGAVMMSLDSAHYLALTDMCREYLKKYDCINKEIYVCLIGHPKLFGEINYSNMQCFLHEIRNKYGRFIRFYTIMDVYREAVGMTADERSRK